MSDSRALTPGQRDAGLRRLRIYNRLLVAIAIGGTGVLAELASRAFPGHARRIAPSQIALVRADGSHPRHRGHRSATRQGRRHVSRDSSAAKLAPPSQAPAASAPAAPQSAAPAPSPAPAPAPVVSGGS